MGRITGLEPDPRREGAVRVLVDGRLFCTVAADQARALSLEVGAAWEGPVAAAAGAAADVEAATRALVRALERRSFSVAEIRRRLLQRGHPAPAVEQAVSRAVAARILDDATFAAQYVASRSARGRGPARLRRDLQVLGVETRHIEAALRDQWGEPADALALARTLAEKRARQLAPLPPAVRRRRVLAYLARRGFSGSGVRDLVRQVLAG